MNYFLPPKKASLALIFFGSLILIIWSAMPGWMRITHPNFTGCNPLTASCFLVFGVAMALRLRDPEKKIFPGSLFLLITGIAFYRIFSGWKGTSFPLDKIIFAGRLQGVQFSMATATCFILTGSAMIWFVFAPRSGTRRGFFLLLACAYIVLFSLLGFMLNEKDVRESLFLSPMSLVTTSLFILLLYSVLSVFRENSLLKVFQSPLLGGLVARKLLPWFLLIPIMVFIFGVIGRQSGVFSYALSGSAQISVLFFALLLVLVKLAQMIDSLDQKQKTSNEMLSANAVILDKVNKDLQTFTYAASHDLQEPLRKISIYAGMLRDRPDSEEQSEYVNKIISSAGRGAQLIRDILQYSRTAYHQESFELTDLRAILVEVIADFDRSDQEMPPRIDLGKMPVVEATPFQMRQLFSNLMSNSLKFALKDRQAIISVSASLLESGQTLFSGRDPGRTYWKIEFTDNGEGFEEKYAGRIFEVFQRVSKNRIAGSGIGLSLCRKIVDAHGGQISARSTPGAGTSFTIILPEKQR